MTDRRVGPPSYRQAQLEARMLWGSYSDEALRSIRRSLRQWSTTIGDILRRTKDRSERAKLLRIMKHVGSATTVLNDALRSTISTNRLAAYEAVQNVWKTIRKIEGAPDLRLLGMFEDLHGPWETSLFKYVRVADSVVRAEIGTALATGLSAEKLAAKLVPFMRGTSEKDILFKARRIALTEIHNATEEAALESYVLDPNVKAVAWRLSPNRGPTARIPDICDALAENDFYGLGRGIYPLDTVPLPPHPFDKCNRVPLLIPGPRRVAIPRIKSANEVTLQGVSQTRGAAIRTQLRSVLTETEGAQSRSQVQQLVSRTRQGR